MSRLADIESREKVATKGPWRASTDRLDDVVVWGGVGDAILIMNVGRPIICLGDVAPQDRPNAEFIAGARDDVPWMIARLRQCEEALRDAEVHMRTTRMAESARDEALGLVHIALADLKE